jgi:hypothetical protein
MISDQPVAEAALMKKLEEFSQVQMSALRMEMLKEEEERKEQLDADSPESLEENGQIISMLEVSQSKLTSYGMYEVVFMRGK